MGNLNWSFRSTVTDWLAEIPLVALQFTSMLLVGCCLKLIACVSFAPLVDRPVWWLWWEVLAKLSRRQLPWFAARGRQACLLYQELLGILALTHHQSRASQPSVLPMPRAVEADHGNGSQSGLLTVPDELLLAIAAHLDGESLLELALTCTKFTPVLLSAYFSRYNLKQPGPHNTRMIYTYNSLYAVRALKAFRYCGQAQHLTLIYCELQSRNFEHLLADAADLVSIILQARNLKALTMVGPSLQYWLFGRQNNPTLNGGRLRFTSKQWATMYMSWYDAVAETPCQELAMFNEPRILDQLLKWESMFPLQGMRLPFVVQWSTSTPFDSRRSSPAYNFITNPSRGTAAPALVPERAVEAAYKTSSFFDVPSSVTTSDSSFNVIEISDSVHNLRSQDALERYLCPLEPGLSTSRFNDPHSPSPHVFRPSS